MTLSSEQWEKVDKQYCNLLWKISHKISGDRAIASPEDNFAELQIVSLEAVAGFEKKTGRKFDDFWGEKLFDQYFKTCLWNYKNNKGGRIAQRYNIHRDVVSTSQNEEVLQITDRTSADLNFEYYLEEISSIFTEKQKEVLEILVRCPSAVKVNGSINTSKIATKLGKTWNEVHKIVESLEGLLKK